METPNKKFIPLSAQLLHFWVAMEMQLQMNGWVAKLKMSRHVYQPGRDSPNLAEV